MSDFDISVSGDDDQWMLLERVSTDGYLLVVRSRINPTIDKFVESNVTVAVICDVLPEFVRQDGMPTCMDELYELEDNIVAMVGVGGAKVFHTASATGDGRRVVYFATESEFEVETLLTSIVCDVANISVFRNIELEIYRQFVTPTKLDRQFDGDQAVISNLESHGDDGSKPRKVDFWFYGERNSLDKLVKRLAADDFDTDHWLDDPLGVVLTKVSPVDFLTFRQITPLLVETSLDCDVDYDGWETLVVAEKSATPVVVPKSTLLSKLFGKRKI